MLCANVAADLLENAKLPALYRVHEGPNQDKLDSLRDFLSEMGLYLSGGDEPTTGDYQKVLQQIAERPDRHLLQTQVDQIHDAGGLQPGKLWSLRFEFRQIHPLYLPDTSFS